MEKSKEEERKEEIIASMTKEVPEEGKTLITRLLQNYMNGMAGDEVEYLASNPFICFIKISDGEGYREKQVFALRNNELVCLTSPLTVYGMQVSELYETVVRSFLFLQHEKGTSISVQRLDWWAAYTMKMDDSALASIVESFEIRDQMPLITMSKVDEDKKNRHRLFRRWQETNEQNINMIDDDDLQAEIETLFRLLLVDSGIPIEQASSIASTSYDFFVHRWHGEDSIYFYDKGKKELYSSVGGEIKADVTKVSVHEVPSAIIMNEIIRFQSRKAWRGTYLDLYAYAKDYYVGTLCGIIENADEMEMSEFAEALENYWVSRSDEARHIFYLCS